MLYIKLIKLTLDTKYIEFVEMTNQPEFQTMKTIRHFRPIVILTVHYRPNMLVAASSSSSSSIYRGYQLGVKRVVEITVGQNYYKRISRCSLPSIKDHSKHNAMFFKLANLLYSSKTNSSQRYTPLPLFVAVNIHRDANPEMCHSNDF
jgi:hypothetical protein